MRVVTPEEMARIDAAAIEAEKIPGLSLMEAAGEAVARAARDMLARSAGRRVVILCGKGNNGGDGFVAARLLAQAGIDTRVLLLAEHDEIKGDAALNFGRLESLRVEVQKLQDPREAESVIDGSSGCDLVIDAIFGTGFSGKAEGLFEAAIMGVNNAGCPVLSVDIPSGVDGRTGSVEGAAVQAQLTVTFAALKVGLVQYPGAARAGEVEVADIGIPGKLVDEVPDSDIRLVSEDDAEALLPERPADAHKRQSGAVLAVGGSPGLTGAAALCAQAALRCGAGLVTLGVPEGLHDIMEVKLTEVMTRPLWQTPERTLSVTAAAQIIELCDGFDVLALGPGLSTAEETAQAVRELVASVGIPVVLDADGLNALVGHTHILTERRASLVLTPHPGEMSRLLNCDSASVQADRVGTARGAAVRWSAVVILKGAGSVVSEPGGAVRVCSSGNQGMATAGMGDVLTGCVASFIAQGLDPFEAAVAGTFYHGHAADLAASMDGMIGMVAGDVIRHLPLALRRLKSITER